MYLQNLYMILKIISFFAIFFILSLNYDYIDNLSVFLSILIFFKYIDNLSKYIAIVIMDFKMKSGYAVLVIIIVVGMLLLSGCIGENEFDINKVIEAQKNVKQYVFESKITMHMAGISQLIFINKTVDTENKKIYINMNTTIPGQQNIKIYIISGKMYTNQNGMWKMKNDYLWNSPQEYESTLEILKSPNTKVNVTGEESVDGEVCYKINISADTEKLKEHLVKNLGGSNARVAYTLNVSSYTLYISKATNFIKKEEINANVTMSSQGMNIEIEMTYISKYKDINKPTDIQLPDEARNTTAIN